MQNSIDLIIQEQITRSIHLIRNQKVMMDSDLAEMYGVETKVLNQAVKRNLDRFPEDFMFQLSNEEWENLRGMIEERMIVDGTENTFLKFSPSRG
jgi:RNA binding exosome subunit